MGFMCFFSHLIEFCTFQTCFFAQYSALAAEKSKQTNISVKKKNREILQYIVPFSSLVTMAMGKLSLPLKELRIPNNLAKYQDEGQKHIENFGVYFWPKGLPV